MKSDCCGAECVGRLFYNNLEDEIKNQLRYMAEGNDRVWRCIECHKPCNPVKEGDDETN